jgi:hypothetical protein
MDHNELELIMELLFLHYDPYFLDSTEAIIAFAKEDFEVDLTAAEVEPYVYIPLPEEEDARRIYENV